MNWQRYFEETHGTGFLATADGSGRVNIAIYSRPHGRDDGTLVFGMADRLTHANLQENPHAVYAFQEKGFQGVRLYLEKALEEDGGPLLEQIRERAESLVGPGTGAEVTHLVGFRVTKALTLVGDRPPVAAPPDAA